MKPLRSVEIAAAELSRISSLAATSPRQVLINVTNMCNSRCTMCGIWKIYKDDRGPLASEMTLEEFRHFIRTNASLKDITLTGGEAYMRNDILEFFLTLSDAGYDTGVATNSLLPDRVKSVTLAVLDNMKNSRHHDLQVSIDGIGEMHDTVRGVPGNFSKAIELLKWGLSVAQHDPRLRVSVSHTITARSYRQLPDFVDTFVDMGIPPADIHFRPAQYAPSYYANRDGSFQVTDIPGMAVAVQEVARRHPYYRDDLFVRGILKFLANPTQMVIPCFASFTFCYIDPYWNVYPCITWLNSVGNLRDYGLDLATFWRKEERLQPVREQISRGHCPNCWTECMAGPTMNSDGVAARILLRT